MTTETTTTTFIFNNSPIRATKDQDGIWFSLQDVAKALDYRKTFDLSRLAYSGERDRSFRRS